jgi:uncharacterized membrane protein YhhN
MNKFFFIGAFFVALVANIAGGEMGNTMLQYVSKALLMPLLAGYFIYSIKGFSNILSRWLLAALFFSWAGDVLLLFQEKDSLFFMLGLSAFLLAHVFYIIAFQNIRGREAVRFRLLLLAIVAVYYAGLIYLLYPRLANMRLPVLVYGVVISTMFMLAMHMLFIRNRVPGKWMMVGALLFVLSDSTLAVNKFYQAFEGAGIIIMVTYGLAQFSIINGAVEYIRRSND